MHTDKQLLTIFEANPEWNFELTGLPSPGACDLISVALKALEQRADAVIFPADVKEPIRVAEFQGQPDDWIYDRVVMEILLLRRIYPGRVVEGMIFVLEPNLDPKVMPWAGFFRSYCLRELLEEMGQEDPVHPLVASFKPLME